jgi:hypothetical protein
MERDRQPGGLLWPARSYVLDELPSGLPVRAVRWIEGGWLLALSVVRPEDSPPARDFSRPYMIPDQNHCLSNGSPQVNPMEAMSMLLSRLQKWVEQGTAPGSLSFPLLHPTAKLSAISVTANDLDLQCAPARMLIAYRYRLAATS